jgi:hypothetical protein
LICNWAHGNESELEEARDTLSGELEISQRLLEDLEEQLNQINDAIVSKRSDQTLLLAVGATLSTSLLIGRFATYRRRT